ncbi:FAD-binding oxidoreductase [Micromonospora tarensis]|uniref:FAD-dependent oxidoreductase n=1 Tax=Micromonospora tarensis TaxID=2806100 RepID=A0ABS1YRN7_9ACTN|nr:FAD-dependent oxidoreductase [Micromonospora tarensis]MBM0280091.1 FAD-dependent oxidoreductase [Micromonospora tarensis]
MPIAVRSGGHGLSGASSNNGGVVIDLSMLNRVQVLDERAGLVRVEAGARWANVAKALAPYGLVVSSGDYGGVGVGGLATGGGVGWLVRAHGLTIDRVRAVEVVLADGTLVRADAEHEPELFWLVRGAGAGAGIVLAFEIEAAEQRNVGVARLVVEAHPDGRTIREWTSYLARAPRELSAAAVVFAEGRSVLMSVTAVVAAESLRRAGQWWNRCSPSARCSNTGPTCCPTRRWCRPRTCIPTSGSSGARPRTACSPRWTTPGRGPSPER